MKKYYLISLVLFLSACESEFKPVEWKISSDIKPGPGLVSGEKGEFIIYQGDLFNKADE